MPMNNSNYITVDFETLKYNPYTKRRRMIRSALHTHTFWEICYTLDGEFTNNVNGDGIRIRKNEVCVIRPKDVHIYSNPTSDIDYRDIYLTSEEMSKICSRFSPSFYKDLETSEKPLIFKLDLVHLSSIEKSISFFDHLDKKGQEFEDVFLNIVSRIFEYYAETKMQRINDKSKPQFVSGMLDFIDNNPIQVDSDYVVEKMGYSYSHTNRIFIKYTNMSLSRYILVAKMRYAADMLLNTEVPIVQVSEMLGYANQSNFVKAFKKVYSVSPSKWRK